VVRKVQDAFDVGFDRPRLPQFHSCQHQILAQFILLPLVGRTVNCLGADDRFFELMLPIW
jgi:hypothetical protein